MVAWIGAKGLRWCHTKSIFPCLPIRYLNNITPSKIAKLSFWANKFLSFPRCSFIGLLLFFLWSNRLNRGSNRTFSLTLSILSETTEWVRCECRSSHYSKCHSKLITSVSCLAARPSCSDLEKMDGKVTTKHEVPRRRKISNVVPRVYSQPQWIMVDFIQLYTV